LGELGPWSNQIQFTQTPIWLTTNQLISLKSEWRKYEECTVVSGVNCKKSKNE
jgi:hypothetical protein